jgi:DNA-binding XRE family transcriptional regulator
MTEKKERTARIARILGENLKQIFEEFKQEKEKKICPCCMRVLPNIFTQEWLAAEVGISKGTIVHFFQGKRTPQLWQLEAFSKVLEVPISEFINNLGYEGE